MSRLPVLMYHNVAEHDKDSVGLTISYHNLERQFKYLFDNNYTTFHLSELENATSLPRKRVLITFDDVTVNQLEYAVPLLEKYKLKAVFFIPFYYLGKTDEWNGGAERIMTIQQLKSIKPDLIEFGYHSYLHRHYPELSDSEINKDFEQCRNIIAENDLKVYPALAYPYGNYPKKGEANKHFKQLLAANGIKMAFRIGNRVSRFPFPDKYEIQRIDVKGEDSIVRFKLKLKFGKLRLF